MKHIRYKYLSIILYLIPHVLSSQNIKSNTRYLNDLLYLGTVIYTDTLFIESNKNDSLIFNIHSRMYPAKRFLQTGDSVFKTEGLKHILLYDFSLQAGDTFRLRAGAQDSMDYLVDSVTFSKLLDNMNYRHWHLSAINSSRKLTWIEFIGEKNKGWDYTEFKIRYLMAVCQDMQLIVFQAGPEDPTCQFDSLSREYSVNTVQKNKLLLYPNPAVNRLNWSFDEKAGYEIYNMQGAEIQSGEAAGSVDISMLANGNYILIIRKEGLTYRSVFAKT